MDPQEECKNVTTRYDDADHVVKMQNNIFSIPQLIPEEICRQVPKEVCQAVFLNPKFLKVV